MKRLFLRFETALLIVSVTLTSISCGSGGPAANTEQSANTSTVAGNPAPPTAVAQTMKLNEEQLDQLLAPIALYPDPLLAQMIPAATFVDQIQEAQRTLNGNADDNAIANQPWDVSVKSVAHYPPALKMMADDEDWTTTLGQAYVNQPEDINKSIQRLRSEAFDAGNLRTTPQQEVIEKDNIYRIEPAQAGTIYVPQYDPEVVYVEESDDDDDDGMSTAGVIATAAIAFGAGMLIGSWLNRDYDYYGYYGPPGPYYHGWAGSGWIGVNERYAYANRNVYVNNSYRNINVNSNVINRGVNANYRNNLTQRASVRNQRVTNARVNRQLKRQSDPNYRPGVADRDRDRNRGDVAGVDPGRNRDRDRGPGRADIDRTRDRDRPGVDHRNTRDRNTARRNNAGPNTRDRQRPSTGGLGDRQRPNASPRQMQRQGPSQMQRQAPRQQPQRQQRTAPQRRSGGGRRG